jgi:hypothetical protein
LSYDLYLVQAPPTASAEAIGQLALSAAEAGLPTVPLDSESVSNRDRVVAALRASNPNLEPFAFDFADIAKSQGITESEARMRFHHVELNGAEDGNGIQITVFGTGVSVAVPYWHQGQMAETVWNEIWTYLQILTSAGNLRVYDPQLDRPLDLAIDRADVVRIYEQTVQATVRMAEDLVTRPARRPWWRFW